MTAVAPTIEDARRAAEALAAVGVGRVVLFGSVARGEATEHSDVDLVAIYDDIDYSERGAIATPAEAAARAAAGCSVDVLVTDRPEWKMRTTRVRTSLEARAARFGTILVDRPPGAVDWDKEMVMPTDDYQEAIYRLGHTAGAIESLHERLEPSRMQTLYAELGMAEEAHLAELSRLLDLGGSAQKVAESALKALIHVTADPDNQPWGHKIELLCLRLPPPIREYVTAHLLHPVQPEEITRWHRWSRYHERGKDPDPVVEVVEPLIRSVCRLATYTAAQFGDEPEVRRVDYCASQVTRFLDTRSLESGRPLRRRSASDPPGVSL